MIKTYHKTAPIKVEQFDGSNEMVEKYKMMDAGTMIGTQHSPELYLEGSGKVVIGDWIATGVNGEHWTIADDIFKQRCEELPVIPKAVADWINECISLGWTRNFLDVCYRAPEPVDKWIDNNSNMFARAWLGGYQVEAQHDTRTD